MADVQVFLGVQRLNLTNGQWDTLVTAMQAKGQHNQDPNPARRNHWRPSLDGNTWIFEAVFDSDVVDVQWFISWVAGVFGVDPLLILETTAYNSYGRFSTFNYLAINRFRVGVFGFVQGQGWPSWADSRAAARQYVRDNLASWEA